MRSYKLILLTFFISSMLLFALTVPRAEKVDEQDRFESVKADSTYHITAGSTTLKEQAGENVLNLTDGVKIIHGNVTITSRRGVQYTKRQVTFLVGDVEITQMSLRIRGEECEYRRAEDLAIITQNVRIRDRGWDVLCDKAVLYRTSERMWLTGNVSAVDSSTTLKADSIFYDSALQKAEVFGNVNISNAKEGFTVTGRHGFYFRDRREGLMDRKPHLIADPKSPEPATVDSDTMRFYPDERRASAYGRVKIIKGETVTQCDSAVVFDKIQHAELYGSPLAKQGDVSMQGDVMFLHYVGREVDRIVIKGQARIDEQQPDSLIEGRNNWVKGDSMSLYLSANTLDSLSVKGSCVSEYFPASPRKVESNFARGDSMFFTFLGDTLSVVKIIGRADGVYAYVDLKSGETCDSLRSVYDTTLVYVPFSNKSEKVSYSAQEITYRADTRDILLKGGSKVYYQNRTLFGDRITYNSTLQLLDARGSPILIEGDDKFYGSQMDYDLVSGVGLVKNGSTKFQEGYYFGREVAKVGDNILKVWHSTYTTCDLKKPHYHFASKEMKVFLRDKVVSGPIWLYIGNTPIAFLPFLANNISKGRRSGFLRPEFEFGITKSTGRFIRNFGYYWATNDYTDFTFMGDFNEDASFRILANNRYRWRYHLNGTANFSFFRNLSNFTNEWIFSSTHQQDLGEKFSLSSDLRFVSSDKAPSSINRIDQVADVVDRRIESKVSVRKSWDKVGFSASARRVQSLNVVDPTVVRVSTTFPDISLSIPSRNLYFGEATKRGKKSFWENFLGGIRYSPGISMTRSTEERLYNSKETITQNVSLGFSSPRKILFLNISPSLSATNRYTRVAEKITEHTEITTASGVYDTTFVAGGKTVTSDNLFQWSTGASARTNFYGTFYPEIGVLKAIRHTISPSISYRYNPRVGDRPASQSLGVSLNNSLDLKVRQGEGERKVSNVLIWSLSSSYNPQAPAKHGWSTIASSINLKLFGTNLSMNQSIDPYKGDVLSTQVTSYLTLSGTQGFGNSREAGLPELNVIAGDTSSAGQREKKGESTTTWNLSLAYSYSKSQYSIPRSTLNISSGIQLTRNWRITYTTTYDMEDRMFMGQNYTVYRNLHCWEMSFSRQKLGTEWQYYFRIDIKAHPEVYAESGRRGLGRQGFGMPSFY